jgi:hypothetical protein
LERKSFYWRGQAKLGRDGASLAWASFSAMAPVISSLVASVI